MDLDPSYGLKSIEELQAEFVQLATDLAAINDKRVAIWALIEMRKAQAKAEAKVGPMSALEREALKRALESRGQPQ